MVFDYWLSCQASERLHEKMTNFVSKNKAAQIQHGSRLVDSFFFIFTFLLYW